MALQAFPGGPALPLPAVSQITVQVQVGGFPVTVKTIKLPNSPDGGGEIITKFKDFKMTVGGIVSNPGNVPNPTKVAQDYLNKLQGKANSGLIIVDYKQAVTKGTMVGPPNPFMYGPARKTIPILLPVKSPKGSTIWVLANVSFDVVSNGTWYFAISGKKKTGLDTLTDFIASLGSDANSGSATLKHRTDS